MKITQVRRVVAFLLLLSVCTAMYPSIVSAEGIEWEPSSQQSLCSTCYSEISNTNDLNVENIEGNGAPTVYSSAIHNAALVGVTNLGHDHNSALSRIRTNLANLGFDNAYLYSGSFSTSSIDSYLTNNNNNVFISRSHGGVYMNEIFTDEQDATFIVLNDDSSNPVKYLSNATMETLDLSNLKLAMFIGCETGYGGIDEDNLMSQATWQGATTSVGFEDTIYCNEANQWLVNLFGYLDDGMTLREACRELHYEDNWQYTSMVSYVICGNASITLAIS